MLLDYVQVGTGHCQDRPGSLLLEPKRPCMRLLGIVAASELLLSHRNTVSHRSGEVQTLANLW